MDKSDWLCIAVGVLCGGAVSLFLSLSTYHWDAAVISFTLCYLSGERIKWLSKSIPIVPTLIYISQVPCETNYHRQ